MWGAIAGAALPIVAGAIGNDQASGARGDASRNLAEILAMYQNIATPDIEKMKLNLQNYQDVYNYNPQMQTAEQLSSQDNLQNIQLDPRLRQQQVGALDMFNQMAQGGFTPDQLVAMDAQRRQTEGDLTSRLASMQSNQDARGVGNSDFALAQRMMEAQSSANRAAQDNAAARAQAFQQQVNAGMQGANLAGNIEQQDYVRQAALANSQNNREMVNLGQRANVNQSNVANFNDALKSKTTNTQNISNQNTGLANTQQEYNRGLLQTDFNNKLKKAEGVSGAQRGVAADRAADGQRTADMWAGIGSGVSKGLLGMK